MHITILLQLGEVMVTPVTPHVFQPIKTLAKYLPDITWSTLGSELYCTAQVK